MKKLLPLFTLLLLAGCLCQKKQKSKPVEQDSATVEKSLYLKMPKELA